MSFKLFEKNKAQVDENLIADKEEVKEEVCRLSEDELEQVTGGKGDKRQNMNEAMADPDGLMEEVDGFEE